jgi:OHCU decarboxylase
MMPGLQGFRHFNQLPLGQAEAELLRCCGSRAWAKRLAVEMPFESVDALLDASDRIWWSLGREEWLEAFRAHPRIGERAPMSAQAGGGAVGDTHRWSEEEQAGARQAPDDLQSALAEANRAYEARFGHIFIVDATGKSATEMLALLRSRLANDPDTELRVAAEEQNAITRGRLRKLMGAGG